MSAVSVRSAAQEESDKLQAPWDGTQSWAVALPPPPFPDLENDKIMRRFDAKRHKALTHSKHKNTNNFRLTFGAPKNARIFVVVALTPLLELFSAVAMSRLAGFEQ